MQSILYDQKQVKVTHDFWHETWDETLDIIVHIQYRLGKWLCHIWYQCAEFDLKHLLSMYYLKNNPKYLDEQAYEKFK